MIYTATVKSLQSCLTLCDHIDGSPPGSLVPGILQARTLEWVAISFSNAWKWKVKVKSLSHVRLLETPWTAAYQALPPMGFSRQEYWSGVPLPSPFKALVQTLFQHHNTQIFHVYLAQIKRQRTAIWVNKSLNLKNKEFSIHLLRSFVWMVEKIEHTFFKWLISP